MISRRLIVILTVLLFATTVAVTLTASEAPQEHTAAYQGESWRALGVPPGGIGYDVRQSPSDASRWWVTDVRSGMHVSTDNGLTWQRTNTGIGGDGSGGPRSTGIFCFSIDPSNADRLWVGTRDPGEIYKSTDGGVTWSLADGDQTFGWGYAFRGFTADPSDSDTVYAMAEVNSYVFVAEGVDATTNSEFLPYVSTGLTMGDWTGGRIFKTTDGGTTWTRIWQGPALVRYLMMDPVNPQNLYVSTGIDDREPINKPLDPLNVTPQNCGLGVLRSQDGGASFTSLGVAEGLDVLTVGSLDMHPTNPQILIAGAGAGLCETTPPTDQGGIYLTSNGGTSWTAALTGYEITTVDICDDNPLVMYGIGKKRIHRSDDSGQNWSSFGDPVAETWGPPGSNPGWPIDAETDADDCLRLLINNYHGGNYLSIDGGQNTTSASSGYSGAGVHDLFIDPSEPNRYFAAAEKTAYRIDNLGGDPVVTGLMFGDLGESLSSSFSMRAITGNPDNPDHLLTASRKNDGRIYYSSTGGVDWVAIQVMDRPAAEATPNMHVPRLVFAPSDAAVVYAATMAVEDPEMFATNPADAQLGTPPGLGVYRSMDGGETWTAPTDPQITQLAVYGLAVHPTDANTVYAGTFGDGGLFKSTDGGIVWTAINTGLPAPPYGHFAAITVDPTAPQTVYAGGSTGLFKSTDGGGSWTQLTAGLDGTAFVSSIVLDPMDTSVVYVGSYTTGCYYSTDGGLQFHALNQGIGTDLNPPVNARVLVITPDGETLIKGGSGFGLYLLDATSLIFSDGFESGDTTAWSSSTF